MVRKRFKLPNFASKGCFTGDTGADDIDKHITSTGLNKVPEVDIRRTILDLDELTDAGRPSVYIHTVSLIAQHGHTARYNKVSDTISISIEPVFMAAKHEGKWSDYLKALTAHEYGHKILDQPDNSVSKSIKELNRVGLFVKEDLNNVMEFYDFPDKQHAEYEDINEFIEHVLQFGAVESARPVEGFCNSLATRYSGMTFEEYEECHDKIRERQDSIGQSIMKGQTPSSFDTPEVWKLEWDNS